MSVDSDVYFEEVVKEDALKVLRNLPYARRGYTFSNSILKDYYETILWYIPNKDYLPKPNDLKENEKAWLENLRGIKIKRI